MDAQGRVLRPLDEAAVEAGVAQLLEAGCESLVIHFLHAYANPAHERRAAEIARARWPNAYVTTGAAVLSEFREYERGVAAAVNASIQPVLARYLSRLDDELKGRGFRRDLLVMQGNGGAVAARLAVEEAVNTVMSGPASGVIAAAYIGARAGFPNLISYDMGGTSSDVGLIQGAIPAVSSELELEYAMPIHVPMVDVHSIGAGGGSIAALDDAGLLRVGPRSAGARPGPICYGRGGTEPTITDANLVLGRLNPDALLGVERAPSIEAMRARIAEAVGAPLGLAPDEAAAAILRVANDHMAGAIRMVSLGRGHDPRDFALFAFGGAGPLHATALARELAIPKVLVPARPGVTNALGCVVADLRHDYVRSVNLPLAELDMTAAHAILAEQFEEGRRTIDREGVAVEEIVALRSAEMQFQGQSHMLFVPLASAEVSRDELQAAFEEAYFARFQLRLPEVRAMLVSLRTAVIGRRRDVSLDRLLDASLRARDLDGARTGRRRVWFEQGWLETPIYARDRLPLGARFVGPAIIEQLDATTVIDPDNEAEVDTVGNLLVTVPPAWRS
jgi:N-methylhydantoinase A